MRRTLDDDHLPHMLFDEHLFRRSLREIKQYVKETPDARGHPGSRLGGLAEARAGLLAGVKQAQAPSLDAVMWMSVAVARPGDQVERLKAVEHVLERLGLRAAA